MTDVDKYSRVLICWSKDIQYILRCQPKSRLRFPSVMTCDNSTFQTVSNSLSFCTSKWRIQNSAHCSLHSQNRCILPTLIWRLIGCIDCFCRPYLLPVSFFNVCRMPFAVLPRSTGKSIAVVQQDLDTLYVTVTVRLYCKHWTHGYVLAGWWILRWDTLTFAASWRSWKSQRHLATKQKRNQWVCYTLAQYVES